MPWEHKDDYAVTLINNVVVPPQLTVMTEWPDKFASFRLDVIPLVPVSATYPEGTVALRRERQYKVFFQGIVDGYVFYEHYGYFGTTYIVIPERIGEVLWSVRKDFDDGFLSDPPMIRIVAPMDYVVTLAGTRLGYKH